MEAFKEYYVELNSKEWGYNENATGMVVGIANAAQPIIGQNLIVLLDDKFAKLIGSRAIVVAEILTKRITPPIINEL